MVGMDSKILKVMEEAARRAGNIVSSSYETAKSARFEEKASFDYVTEIDRESERVITEVIKNAFPDDVIIAEESYDGSYDGTAPAWVIDPLDGTTNFIHGFPMVSISIARLENGIVTAGCVLDPIRDEFFWSIRGKGVFMNDKPLKPRNWNQPLSRALLATGFPFRRKDILQDYLEVFSAIFQVVSDIRRGGSAALDLAYIACGRFDGFWEIGLKPWDIASSMLFIHEIDGVVTDFWGRGEKDVLWNGNIVAASSPLLHREILSRIQSSRLVQILK